MLVIPFFKKRVVSPLSTGIKLKVPEKASVPIFIIEFGIIVVLNPLISSLFLVKLIALQPSRESYFLLPSSTTILDKLEQPLKVLLLISVTEYGILILVKLMQNRNASRSITLIVFGSSIYVRFVHQANVRRPILVTVDGMTTCFISSSFLQ